MHLKKIKVVQCLTLAGPCWVYTSDTETLCSVFWGVIAVLSGVITQAWNMTTGGGGQWGYSQSRRSARRTWALRRWPP